MQCDCVRRTDPIGMHWFEAHFTRTQVGHDCKRITEHFVLLGHPNSTRRMLVKGAETAHEWDTESEGMQVN